MELIYCPEDDTYRIYCGICDKLCINSYYQNHLKSQTHLKILERTIQHLSRFSYLFEIFHTI